MPQPASIPVLGRRREGSSQAPRPPLFFFLRRNCLEDASSKHAYLILLLVLNPPRTGRRELLVTEGFGSSQAPRPRSLLLLSVPYALLAVQHVKQPF